MVREDDGIGGCGERGVEREGAMRGGVKKEFVGDCWRWSGTVRVDGWYSEQFISTLDPPLHTPVHTYLYRYM